jgi:hypothetical protein
MSWKLYELTDEYSAIADLAVDTAEETGEINPDYALLLNAITGDIDDKLERIGGLIKSLDGLREQVDAERHRLAMRIRRLDAALESIKDYAHTAITAMGWKKRQCGIFKFSVCKNSQPSVLVLDLDAVPTSFDKVHARELEKSRIKDAINAGQVVPGVELKQGYHLRVGV